MRRPEIAREITSCWICSVPSKMSWSQALRDAAVRMLAAPADWELVDEIAQQFRRKTALSRLRHKLATSDD